MTAMKKILMGLFLSSSLLGHAWADVLVGNDPYLVEQSGHQSDANSGTYVPQNFVAPSESVLESITWWGFHTLDSWGASFDNFSVSLDGVVQTGDLSITAFGNYFQYTLDVVDTALASTVLSIVNDSSDVEWLWQSAQEQGNPQRVDATAVAFRLNGHSSRQSQDVPEPASLALFLLALGALSLRQAQSRK